MVLKRSLRIGVKMEQIIWHHPHISEIVYIKTSEPNSKFDAKHDANILILHSENSQNQTVTTHFCNISLISCNGFTLQYINQVQLKLKKNKYSEITI